MTSEEFEDLQMQHGKVIDFCFFNDTWQFEFEDHFIFNDPEEENLKYKQQIERHERKKWRRDDD